VGSLSETTGFVDILAKATRLFGGIGKVRVIARCCRSSPAWRAWYPWAPDTGIPADVAAEAASCDA